MEDGALELELVGRAAAGDEGAFRTLVDRHGRMVFNVAYRITADRAAAEDVVQETFLRAYRALHRFDGRAGFATWIHRIAMNASLDVLRQTRTRREVAYEAEEGVLDPAPSPEPGPERVAVSGDLRRALARAMATLTDVERIAFVLRHYEGRSTVEIGERLGLQSSATRQAVFRAVRKLRLALAPFVGEGAHERAAESGAP
jgi:RNA polymerase sigma-70 factor (ECF subfamily)